MSTEQAMRDLAIERFRYRKKNPLSIVINGRLVTGDNSELPAGYPMVYLCKHCRWPIAILDEQFFLSRPNDMCSECAEMEKRDWLPEAIHGEEVW